MKAYSQDLREKVVRAYDEGRGSPQQIADTFGVSASWVRRLLQRRRETGSFAALPHAGGPAPKMTPDRCARLIVLVAEQPDATLAELRDRLGVAVHQSTLCRALARLGLPVKKKSSGRPNRTAPTCNTRGPASGAGRPALTPAASSSSTRRG
jgi:transposase